LQDIVHQPPPAERLVVPNVVERECADQFSVLGDDANVRAGDEKIDSPVFVGCPHRDVSQSAEVAEGDLAEGYFRVLERGRPLLAAQQGEFVFPLWATRAFTARPPQ
jgi:hypothetical protein